MVTKLEVGLYMQDVALHTLLGPYGIPLIGMQVFRDAYEGDYRGVARGAAVEGGALATSYGMLQLLNYLQGPKYAKTFMTLHKEMTAGRTLIGQAIVTNPVAIYGAAVTGMALMTAKRPDLTQHTYQGAMTGQPSIGSAGHELIYGNMKFRL